MNHEKCVRARGVEGERARLTWSVLVLIGVLVGALAVAAAVLPGNWRPPTDAPPARGCAAPEADLPPPAAAPAVPDGGVPRRLTLPTLPSASTAPSAARSSPVPAAPTVSIPRDIITTIINIITIRIFEE